MEHQPAKLQLHQEVALCEDWWFIGMIFIPVYLFAVVGQWDAYLR